MWLERHVKRIRAADPVTLIDGTPDLGSAWIIQELLRDSVPTLWLDFSGFRSGGTQDIWQILAQDGWGFPNRYRAGSLAAAITTLQRLAASGTVPAIALSGADEAPELAAALLEQAGRQFHVIIAGTPQFLTGLEARAANHLQIDAAALRLLPAEARDLSFGRRDSQELGLLLEKTAGAFGAFKEQLQEPQAAVPPSPRGLSGRHGTLSATSLEEPLDLLLRFRLWRAALQESLSACPERLAEVIHKAGEECLAEGQLWQLRRLLTKAPQEVRHSEPVLFWLLHASAFQARDPGIEKRVHEHLEAHAAPRLRAFAASLGLLAFPLREAEIARQLAPGAFQSRQQAQVTALHGDPQAAASQLRGQLQHDVDENPVRRVTAVLALARACLLRGSYADARHWARHALELCAVERVPYDNLQFAASGLLAQASLLLGDTAGLQASLNARPFPPELYGQTFTEPFLVGRAHHLLVKGMFEEALVLYGLMESLYGSNGEAAAHTVRALLRARRFDEASVLAQQFLLDYRLSTPLWSFTAKLAWGTVLAARRDRRAVAKLQLVMEYAATQETFHALLLAEAAIVLAQFYLREGEEERVITVLHRARPALTGLAGPGWQLFGGSEGAIEVRRLWEHNRAPFELFFLGHNETLDQLAGGARMNPRWRELLFVLSSHPEGLSGDRLAGLLGFKRGELGTMRSYISKLRKHYPIQSRPYRINAPVRTDYGELLKLIERKELGVAIKLYSGPLLADSDVAFIEEFRAQLEEALRQAVLLHDDGALTLQLAEKLGSDMELWERAVEQLSASHPRRAFAAAALKNLRRRW